MKRALLALLLFLLLLAACAPAAAPEPQDEPDVSVIMPLQFSVLESHLGKYNPPGAGSSIAFRARASVYNPNPFPVRMRAMSYEISVRQALAGEGRVDTAVWLRPGASEDLTLALELDLRQRPELVRGVAEAFSGGALPFDLGGTVELEALGYRSSFSEPSLASGQSVTTETVRAPELHFSPESSAFRLEANVPVISIIARAENPGDIGYFIYGSNLQLILEGEVVAEGDLRPSPLPAGGSARLELLFYPDTSRLDSIGRLMVSRAVEGEPMLAEVRGSLQFDVLGIDTYRAELLLLGTLPGTTP